MKVFVTGGTGEIGRPAVRALRDAGHAVQVSSRSLANDELILGLGGIPVRVDLQHRDSVVAAVADADAVIHLATQIPPTDAMGTAARWRANDRLRRETTRHLIDGALASRAQIVILQSYFAVTCADGDRGREVELTDARPAWSGIPAMVSMRAAEEQMGRLAAAGIRGVTLRFGSLYSETSEQLHAQVRALVASDAIIVGPGTNYWPFVHSQDAGRAVADALAVPSGAYHIADRRSTTLNEFWEMAAATVGVPLPARGQVAGDHPMAPILLGSWREFSTGSAGQLSGWRPWVSSVLQGWPSAAERFLAENTPRRRSAA